MLRKIVLEAIVLVIFLTLLLSVRDVDGYLQTINGFIPQPVSVLRTADLFFSSFTCHMSIPMKDAPGPNVQRAALFTLIVGGALRRTSHCCNSPA